MKIHKFTILAVFSLFFVVYSSFTFSRTPEKHPDIPIEYRINRLLSGSADAIASSMGDLKLIEDGEVLKLHEKFCDHLESNIELLHASDINLTLITKDIDVDKRTRKKVIELIRLLIKEPPACKFSDNVKKILNRYRNNKYQSWP